MKILNKEEFYKLPNGTIFSKYEPVCFDGLYVKEDTIYSSLDNEKKPIDYFYCDLIGNIDFDSTEDFFNIPENSKEKGNSFKLDFETIQRDGLFKEEEFFAIYEKEDIKEFIKKLESLVEE